MLLVIINNSIVNTSSSKGGGMPILKAVGGRKHGIIGRRK